MWYMPGHAWTETQHTEGTSCQSTAYLNEMHTTQQTEGTSCQSTAYLNEMHPPPPTDRRYILSKHSLSQWDVPPPPPPNRQKVHLVKVQPISMRCTPPTPQQTEGTSCQSTAYLNEMHPPPQQTEGISCQSTAYLNEMYTPTPQQTEGTSCQSTAYLNEMYTPHPPTDGRYILSKHSLSQWDAPPPNRQKVYLVKVQPISMRCTPPTDRRYILSKHSLSQWDAHPQQTEGISYQNTAYLNEMHTANRQKVYLIKAQPISMRCTPPTDRRYILSKYSLSQWDAHPPNPWHKAVREEDLREKIKMTNKQKAAEWHSKEGGNHLEHNSSRQTTIGGFAAGLHPAVDEQCLSELKWIRRSFRGPISHEPVSQGKQLLIHNGNNRPFLALCFPI